ncbi:HK97 family phage prohead protease [Thermoanaerobacterium thermosaccharolyticum]|uniref:HK97 family phage prohead protease n=1 Tax=Thermoanaerobacterium thermosaccharolyticum TaxID=1517 RepID=UPI003D2743DD
MSAIAIHHTATSDKSWDGPKTETKVRSGENKSYYHKIYAWEDPNGDPLVKNTYKFIHHEVDDNGNPGAANIKACTTGIAILNGARGGTNIPDADYEGVWRHLAAHLQDAGLEAPELKRSIESKIERRAFTLDDVAIQTDENTPKITGYAAIFDSLSDDLGGFREIIRYGAFTDSLNTSDIRALWNHNPDYVLGRNRSGTLKLSEDEKGLRIEVVPPNTQWAKDLMEVIKRGDVNQMSFGFRTIEDRWSNQNGMTLRELLKVDLFDVSPVTFPAYPQTEVGVRSTQDVYKSYLASIQANEEPQRRNQARVSILRKKLKLIEKEMEC